MVENTHKPEEFKPIDTPIHYINSEASFSQLSDKEALYAYYMTRASWEGAKICYFQRSYESPALMVLFSLVFGDGLSLKENAISAGVTEVEWQQMCVYVAAVFQNCGNFSSFGDKKFVPELTPEKFKAIVKASKAYKTHTSVIDEILTRTEREIFVEEEPLKHIAFPDNNGQTSYYSSNCTSKDAAFIDEFCQKNGISPLNTRLFKSQDGKSYNLRVCSKIADSEKTPYLKKYELADGITVDVTAADFNTFMERVVDSLEQAEFYAATDNQTKMITDYIEHFKYGDMEKHKDSQRKWIKDIGPSVETNIGFIETYLDPSGARAEFEGFVSVVDKKVSKLFNTLVDRAEGLIEKLPWSADFEKATFSKPDFTNLDIVAFACSGTPIGINIPNYDDIRQLEGFKNVNLGNVYPKPAKSNIQFIDDADADHMCTYSKDSLTLIVALHELLGHGTGKLFQKDDKGELNFDPAKVKNPFTGEEITSFYQASETWAQKFGKLHSGYEECRADSVALHLIHFAEPFEIFFKGRENEWDDIFYGCWMDMLYKGLRGLLFFNPADKTFGQAHMWAGWVIFSAVREGDPELIKIEFVKDAEGNDDISFKLDRTRLREHGFKAISDFLHKLHVYKSMGDFDAAQKFFTHYSQVDEKMLKARDIIIAKKKPRRLELQPNLVLGTDSTGSQKVTYKAYPETHEGIIQSHLERYPGTFRKDVYDQWLKDAEKVRMPMK